MLFERFFGWQSAHRRTTPAPLWSLPQRPAGGPQLRKSGGQQPRKFCIGRRKINLSTVSASQNVGIKKVSDKVWLVSFIQYDLGLFDQELGIMSTNEIPGFI